MTVPENLFGEFQRTFRERYFEDEHFSINSSIGNAVDLEWPCRLRLLNLKSSLMKKVALIFLFVLGVGFLLPADSLASKPAPVITPQYRYLQDNDIRFERISVEGGLSQSTVTCILQDRQGYIWFATRDGLNRYNGYEFEIFDHDPANPLSLSDNVILSLYEDSAGIIWIGTERGGLNQLYQPTGMMIHYALGDDTVHVITEDQAGVIWLGTDSGIDRIDRNTGYISHAQNHLVDDEPVHAILQDHSGVYWFGTGSGLVQYDRTQNTYTRYRYDPIDNSSISGNNINALYEDHAGELWIGTDNGLSKFNRMAGNFTRYRHNPNEDRSLGENAVNVIYEDADGILWVGTEAGLDRFDRESNAFVHYVNDPVKPHSLSSDNILAVFEDREGILWVGTDTGGINKAGLGRGNFTLFQSQPGESNSLTQDIVRAIHEEQDGSLWIGTANGLDRFDRATGQFKHYSHDPRDHFSLSDDVILSIYEDKANTLWIGTLLGGLHKFDRQTEQFTAYQNNFRDPLSLSDNTVRVIFEDYHGVLWVGTNHGLNRFDDRTESFNSYIYFKDIGTNTIRDIFEDRTGVLWVGTDTGLFYYDRAVNRFNPIETSKPSDGLSANLVLSIHEDRMGTLWIGTFQGGLNKYDRETLEFKYYRKSDGLPSDVVYGILEDDLGFLWISTSRGLARFDPQTEIFTAFDVTDGIQNNEFSEGAYYKSSAGELYFGGISGLTAFDPEGITSNAYVPPVVLTSLTQGGEPVLLDRRVDIIDEVTFSWPKNFFEFEFAALSFQHPEDNQYAYILEGFEDDWNTIGTKRFGRYTNLPGGKYIFKVIGSNNDGVWNEAGASLKITIIPPFWETWWFMLIFGSLLVGGILGGYRWRVRNVEARSRELENLVQMRTAELFGANQRLTSEIRERQRVEGELAQRAVESAVEEERNRLARDLHDAVTQTLFSASLIAEVLPRLWSRDKTEGQRRLDELRELTRGALAEMRTLLLELRPTALIEAELGDLLRQLAESITGRSRIPVTMEQEGKCDFPSEVKIALYRIAQEALNNIAKHAASSQAEIHLRCHRDQVILSIHDNGPGFDLENLPPESLGIGIMKERAEAVGAELEIKSQTGQTEQGTEVIVTWQR